MNNEYGLRKLVLINSANYLIAEVPLDDSVSLIGKNNSGKTSLINALQYLMIRDRQQMDFDPHDKAASAKFYFPKASSYILLEMQLKSGLVVVGCVGKGISNEYLYFSYEGSLNVNDFKDDEGNIIEGSILKEKFEEKGKSIDIYRRSTEFFNNLYGRGELSSGELDIRLFTLQSPQLKNAFQKVLIKTLHLDRLNARDVKEFLLQINAVNYSKEASQNAFDFKKTWDEAFQSVEYDRAQFNACKRSLDSIGELRKKFNRTRELRGKIGVMRPIINDGLARWEEYKNSESERLNGLLNDVTTKQADLSTQHDGIIADNVGLKHQLDQISDDNQKFENLQRHFQLVNDRSALEINFHHYENEVAEFQTRINNAKSENIPFVKSRIAELIKSIGQMERELESGDQLFKRKVQSLLSAEEMDVLNGLLNARVLSLNVESIGDVDRFARSFKAHLEKCGDVLDINGLKVRREDVSEHYEEKSTEEITQNIKSSENELENYRSQLSVLEDNAKALDEFNTLKNKRDEAKRELDSYDEFENLRASAADRVADYEKISAELSQNKERLESIKQMQKELSNRDQKLRLDLKKVEDDDQEISNVRDKRLDIQYFTDVLQMAHDTFVYEDEIMANLKNVLTDQNNDCRELLGCSSAITSALNTLQQRGFIKFLGVELQDELIEKTIEYADCLDKEETQIQKNLVVAIARVANVLRELENQFNYFSIDVQEFNKLISKRAVSDLQKLKLELNTHDLLDAVKTIAKHGNDDYDAMDLFHVEVKEGSAGNPEIDKAKDILIRFCNQQGSLKLSDLFDLSFVVQKTGETEKSFSDLTEIGSNGTVLMSKLIFGLALLYMMSDKKKMATSVCYLDEAASIDEQNQKNLIETAKEFGFHILFASPTPLTTVKYCIRIEKQNNKNIISSKQWIRLDDITEVAND